MNKTTCLARLSGLGLVLVLILAACGDNPMLIPSTATVPAVGPTTAAYSLLARLDTIGTYPVFSPDNKVLALAANRSVELWDMATFTKIAELSGDSDTINHAIFSPDGKLLAGTTDYDEALVWDMASRKIIQKLVNVTGPNASAGGVSDKIVFSPDGKLLAYDGAGKHLKVWDTVTWKEVTPATGLEESTTLVFSPDNKQLVSINPATQSINVWNTSGFNQLTSLTFNPAANVVIMNIVYSPDSTRLLAADKENSLKSWDMTSFKQLTAFSLASTSNINGNTVVNTLGGVAFSPDTKLVANYASKDVNLLNTADYAPVATLKGHTGNVSALVFSPDGKLLASGSQDTTIKLWDTTTFKEVTTLKGNTSEPYTLAFSSDGKILAAGDKNRVNLWKIK